MPALPSGRLRLILGALLSVVLGVTLLFPPGLGPLLPGRAADSAAEDLEHNRRLLEQRRTDPAHYARLRHDWRLFLALPAEEQDRLRRLDRELHEEDAVTSARLLRVLERYVDWAEHLPPAEWQLLVATRSPKERLVRIKEIREREWVERLPRALREELHHLAASQRQARTAELRQEERKRRAEWQVAIRHWDELMQKRPQPARLADFSLDVRSFVRETLLPMLSLEEQNRLQRAEGRWPLYPRTLVELSDQHPILLPGPPTGPVRFQELPADVQKALPGLKNAPPPIVRRAEGKWPQYAIAVADIARRRNLALPLPLGPSRPEEFAPAIQEFLAKQLRPVLELEDKNRLKRAEGQWPRYPQLLLDLARKHYLQVPGMGLPGLPELWDRFRTRAPVAATAPPEIPDEVLRDFARTELNVEERADLASFSDPAVRERLKQEYIKRYPKEWQKLLQMDQQKRQRKGKNQ